MGKNTSAGAYVTEEDLSQRISLASTTIGVVVGPSERGPVMQKTLITSHTEFLARFGKPTPRTSKMHYAALAFLDQGDRLYVTRVVETNALTAGCYLTVDDLEAETPILKLTNFDDGSNQPLGVYDPLNTVGFDPEQPGIENILGFFAAIDPGTWNNNLYIRIRSSNPAGSSVPEDPYVFFVDIFENYVGTKSIPNESFLVCRDYQLDGYGRQLHIEEVINSKSKLVRYKANSLAPKVKVLSTFAEFLDGGSNGSPATEGSVVQGWSLYTDPEELEVNILMQAGFESVAVQQKIVQVAEGRGDAVAILEVPGSEQEVSDAVAFRTSTLGLNTSYGALYTPDVRVYDEFNDLEIDVSPSGFIGATYARTDRDAAVWFAPAGLDRGLLPIRGVTQKYNQGMRDAFDDYQINPIRVMKGRGFVVWGANTLQTKASALSNVNVRRLLNFAERSIQIASLYSVFNPNNEILWMKLRELCDRLLKPIKRGRGLYTYGIQCDEKINTPEVIANGDTLLRVYFDPVIPAKRIFLNATVTATGAKFTSSAN